jgi:hypothetical protein
MAATTKTLPVQVSTGTGRQANDTQDVAMPSVSTGRSAAVIGVLTETVTVAQFTDGGSTSGTYQMAGSIPAGAVALLSKVGPIVGFAGDTTAVLIIGDGSDTDRYNTSTVNVFATAAVGVDAGIRSGLALHTAAVRPTLTITSSADFTSVVSNAAGVLTVQIFYIEPLL